MSDYWLETGAVIFLGYCALISTALLALGIWVGVWPLLAFVPLAGLPWFGVWHLWKTRPSVQDYH